MIVYVRFAPESGQLARRFDVSALCQKRTYAPQHKRRGYSPKCQSALSAKCLTEHSSMRSEYPGGRNELSQSSPKRVLTAFRLRQTETNRKTSSSSETLLPKKCPGFPGWFLTTSADVAANFFASESAQPGLARASNTRSIEPLNPSLSLIELPSYVAHDQIFAKSPWRPRPSWKRLAPDTPSLISASRPLYHSWINASRTPRP